MNLLFWGLTIGVIGKVLVVSAVLISHSELAHEKRVDKLVLKSFKLERTLTLAGLILIVAGYSMEIYFYDFVSLLTCVGAECEMNAAAILAQ